MSKACKTCKGRGRWKETETAEYQPASNELGFTLSGQESIEVWHECNDCNGTGIDQDPESADDYDIGGDSYAAED